MSEKKVNINYIIASYNAQGKRKYGFPQDTLKIHLRQLKELKNNLTQITLMKAEVCKSKRSYPDYYYSEEEEMALGLQVFNVENRGYSNGQWLRGYERRTMEYDYYIFSEDDYCPGIHFFNSILINLYRNKFKDNIGFMASLIQGAPKHPMDIPLHHEGLVVVSRETLKKLYKVDNNPKKFLTCTKPPYTSIRTGGREQVNFTTIFRLAEIPIDDTITNYPFIYWSDCVKDSFEGEIYFFEKHKDYSRIVNKFYYENLNEINTKLYMGIPIQFVRTCFLVAGMHRSGTSVLSGSLNLVGLDYGKNKANVKDIFNEHSYFENMSILHFNEHVLAHIHSQWHDTKTLTSEQVTRMLDKKDMLANIIRDEFTTNHFFIKDPRISILLPLYLEVFKKMCIQVLIVFIDRNNESISKSLQRAQGINLSKGLELCHKYKNLLYKNRNNHILYKFDFDSFMEHPTIYVQDILNYGNRNLVLTENQKEKIKSFVNPSKYVHF
jgi:hypothetical protein